MHAEIGKAFTTHYYQTFDATRVNLQTLYKEDSLMTFENEQFMGMQAIMTKLTVTATSRGLACLHSAQTFSHIARRPCSSNRWLTKSRRWIASQPPDRASSPSSLAN